MPVIKERKPINENHIEEIFQKMDHTNDLWELDKILCKEFFFAPSTKIII